MEPNRDRNIERRREQNRLAQRRFRERHGCQKKVAPFQSLALLNPDELQHRESAASDCLSLDFIAPSESLDLYVSKSMFSGIDLMNLDTTHANFGSEPAETPVAPSSQLQTPLRDNYTEGVPSPTSLPSPDPVAPGIGSPHAGTEETDREPTSEWLSPLHMAAHKGHDKIVRMLIQHTSNCNEKDGERTTPLMLAVQGGYEDVARTLLSHGARVSDMDAQGRSSLHWAVIRRRESLLQLLLDNCPGLGAAVNSYNVNGLTPLHTAIDIGFEAGVQVLLRYGADVSMKARKMGL